MRIQNLVTLLGLWVVLVSNTWAAPLKVLTTGAFKSVLMDMVPAFEARTGHQVEVKNETAGALLKMIAAGETFDLVVLTPGALKTLAQEGKVDAASVASIAKVGIGVAVKAGAPKPALSSVDDFKAALRQVQKVAWIDPTSGGSSGIYLEKLFGQMGLMEMVKPKSVMVFGGLVANKLVTGEADLAIHQISEILPVQGAELVGPLPETIQSYTTYGGAWSPMAKNLAGAREFLNMMTSPQAQQVIERKGMQKVP